MRSTSTSSTRELRAGILRLPSHFRARVTACLRRLCMHLPASEGLACVLKGKSSRHVAPVLPLPARAQPRTTPFLRCAARHVGAHPHSQRLLEGVCHDWWVEQTCGKMNGASRDQSCTVFVRVWWQGGRDERSGKEAHLLPTAHPSHTEGLHESPCPFPIIIADVCKRKRTPGRLAPGLHGRAQALHQGGRHHPEPEHQRRLLHRAARSHHSTGAGAWGRRACAGHGPRVQGAAGGWPEGFWGCLSAGLCAVRKGGSSC